MKSLRDYSVVTAAYWTLTLTDGAMRVMVLLHLHELGHSALEIASLFLLYEFFGVVTNFLGGYIGTRFGLKVTLFSGLLLQIVACSMLLREASELTLPWLMASQALAGIAKDLTKMSSKSYIKLVVPRGNESALMKWVSVLTGSKNALKGMGFFLGGLFLSTVGFQYGAGLMVLLLATALLLSAALLPQAPGRASKDIGFRGLFSTDARLNWLSLSRLFLFASRDAWFVLALPLYLGSQLGWDFWRVGGFLALWVIGYGFMQAISPRFVGRAQDGSVSVRNLSRWTGTLIVPLAIVGFSVMQWEKPEATLIIGLAAFAVIFAANSAIHSYLVVSYADEEKIAAGVGFYYAANALGRLIGTWISGALFVSGGDAAQGLTRTLFAAITLVALSAITTWPLRAAESKLKF